MENFFNAAANFDLTTMSDELQKFASEFLVNIGVAIIILIFGLFIIGWFIKLVKRLLEPAKIDKTLKPFIVSLTNISLKVVLIVTVIQVAGVEATTLVAVVGAASLAIGLAFQGALSNFAGGVLILSLRPFHVGDYIEVDGHEGVVEAIHVFNTVIVTLDNKTISIPNGSLAGTTVVNHTEKDIRRIDHTFGVGYETNLREAEKAFHSVANRHPLVLKDPAPFIRLIEHGDSSLNYTFRVWCVTDDYWTVYFDMIDQVKDALDEANISIPFPQMDVHINQQ